MDLWHLPLLTVIGIAVGFLNVTAGGGSLISMPVLIMLGLEPAVANGTNRVAILVQNLTAVVGFKSHGYAAWRQSLGLGLCTVPGAVVGAWAAVAVDPALFKRILGLVLVVSVALIVVRRGQRDPKFGAAARPVCAYAAMVGIGFYGGFLQAGVGFLLMPVLYHLLDLDLIRVNMHKVFVVGIYSIPALLVFALTGSVWWLGGLSLAVGNATGAMVATRFAIKRGEGAIKLVFVAAAVAMGLKLIFS
jgi:uncharacterized membrane protein YfcA